MNLGLVGTGRWGQAYERTIEALPDIALAAVYNSSFRESHLDNVNLDGLIVATPPRTHAAIARAALVRGIPVLIEKPLTLDLDEARALSKIAYDAEIPAMVDHTHLFHPAFERLKTIIRDLGGRDQIRAIRGQAGNSGPVREDVSVLWDWGAHDVAMILDLMGEKPASVLAKKNAFGPGENVILKFEYARVVHVDIDLCNARTERVRSFSVDCAGEKLVYDDTKPSKLFQNDNVVPISAELPLTRAVAVFVAAIRSGHVDRSDVAFGCSVVEVLDACQRSMISGVPVSL